MGLKDDTKQDFESADKNTWESLQTGCLMRIADATESMAKEYNRLIADNQYLSRTRRNLADENKRVRRSNSALRGVITKMKRK